jgi:hypothetical protein
VPLGRVFDCDTGSSASQQFSTFTQSLLDRADTCLLSTICIVQRPGLDMGGSRHIGIAMCPPAQSNLHSFMDEAQAQKASGLRQR